MNHAMQQEKFHSTVKFRTFSKYDFVKSYVVASVGENGDLKIKEQEERKAAIIADAIEETEKVLLENIATKEDLKNLELEMKKDTRDMELGLKKDMKNLELKIGSDMRDMELGLKKDTRNMELGLKKDMKNLEYKMTIKLTAIMAGLFTFLPLATDFIRHLLKL